MKCHLGLAVLATAGFLAQGHCLAQDAQSRKTQSNSQAAAKGGPQSLTLPGDSSVIRLDVKGPQEVRVGDRYDYEIHVSNVSDNIVLHDVKIRQHSAEGFQIEEASLDKSEQKKSKKNAEQRGRSDDQQSAADKNSWHIHKLMPGETRRIHVAASSDEEGRSRTCIAVTSFTPALCLSTQFVKPDLEVVKQAPKVAHVCAPIEVEYYIKNEGTAATKSLTIRDQLGEGLQTASGDQELEFQIQKLDAGETRKFVAQVRATRKGTFSSRAVVKEQGGEETRSNAVKTEVRQAQLAVAIEGPDTAYYGRPMTFKVRVTNSGDAPAPDATLALFTSDGANLAQAGDVRESSQAVEYATNISQGTPTLADERDAAQAKSQLATLEKKRRAWDSEARSWKLGTLDPGETREVRYTMRGDDAGMFEQQAMASYVCSIGDDQQQVESLAMTETEVISLPALLVAVVDENDPVKVGGEVVYNLVVENQGTAADEDIQITAELPTELELVEVTGESKVESSGNNLRFQSVDRLDAGERVAWKIRAKVKQEGDVRLKVNLTSKAQQNEVRSEEPTRLFQTDTK